MTQPPLPSGVLEQVTELAVVLLDRDGRVVDWLPGAENIFGYEAREMLGHGIDCLFVASDIERGTPRGELETALRQGRSEDERWMVRKDGAEFWASGFVRALRGADGDVVGFAKLLRDRTDQRALVEALDNRADALQANNRELTLLLGKVAHELRNPLGVLANAAQLVDVNAGSNERLAYVADLMRRQTAYAGRLIEDLLERVREHRARTTLRSERLTLDRVLEEARETVEPRLRDKRLRVELLLPEAPVELDGDSTRLRQVFVNLLDNAAKFSSDGGVIWMSVTTAGDEAVVLVRDAGAGMPQEILPRVFELFTQAATEFSPREGLGLGLAIVRENVELHGGTVQVRSEGVGGGAEFRVRLPCVRR